MKLSRRRLVVLTLAAGVLLSFILLITFVFAPQASWELPLSQHTVTAAADRLGLKVVNSAFGGCTQFVVYELIGPYVLFVDENACYEGGAFIQRR
jgi:hypothetical protein